MQEYGRAIRVNGETAMTDVDQSGINRDEMPFVAPCRELSPWAPFRWVKLGLSDLMKAPRQSLAYGVIVAALIGIVCLLAWFHGSQWFMFAMLGGFVFLAFEFSFFFSLKPLYPYFSLCTTKISISSY